MEKYENGFSGNEKCLGIFELQKDPDDIHVHLWLLVQITDQQTKRYNIRECEITKFLTPFAENYSRW